VTIIINHHLRSRYQPSRHHACMSAICHACAYIRTCMKKEKKKKKEDLLISAATPDPRNLGRKFIGKRLIFGITRNASRVQRVR
jgi:hypothetical protein